MNPLTRFFADVGWDVFEKADGSLRLTGDHQQNLCLSYITRPYFTAEGEWSKPYLFLRGEKILPGLCFVWLSEDMQWCRWYRDTSELPLEEGVRYIPSVDGWEIPDIVTRRGWAALVNTLIGEAEHVVPQEEDRGD